ncbi:MAG: hypothetical protein GX678_04110 [Actinomycetales bacterium]|nr:hypothetical protein [Actinomycetales bacterium]
MKTKTIALIVAAVLALLALQAWILLTNTNKTETSTPAKESSRTPSAAVSEEKRVPRSLRIKDTNDPKEFAGRVAEVALSWDHINYDWYDYLAAITKIHTPVTENPSSEKTGYALGTTDPDFIQRGVEWVIPPDLDWAALRESEQVTTFKIDRVYEPTSQRHRRENNIPKTWPKGSYVFTVTGELETSWVENRKPQSTVQSHALTVLVECPPTKPCRLAGFVRKVEY